MKLNESASRRMKIFGPAGVLLGLAFLLDVLSSLPVASGSGLGMNWGNKAAVPLPPVAIVNMLKKNKITKVKLFDADEKALLALQNTDIEVMVGVRNEDLINLAFSQDESNKWVDYNVRRWMFAGGTKITAISVGNEAYLPSNEGQFDDAVPAAMEKVLAALKFYKLDKKVKVVTAMNLNVLVESYPPSRGEFNKSLVAPMQKIVNVLQQQPAPYVINIYPFLTVEQQPKDFSMDFIYFGKDGGKNQFVDNATGFTYTNIFDSSYDAVLYALKKISNADIDILIGEIGWPTDGDNGLGFSSKEIAQKYLNGVVQRFLSNQGTPAKPNHKIEAYLFGLLDEDQKSILPGNFERHWGICYYDGRPKFPLDLTGKNDVKRAMQKADDVYYLDRQWCVASPNASTTQLTEAIKFIFDKADTTSILPGNGCYTNDTLSRASYALNNYYQERNQSADACLAKYGGYVVTKDPSTTTCEYRIALSVAKITNWTNVSENSWQGYRLMLLIAFGVCILLALGQ